MTCGERIAIIGNAGGGKTTLARTLATSLDLPLVHVDAVQYRPWFQRLLAEKRRDGRVVVIRDPREWERLVRRVQKLPAARHEPGRRDPSHLMEHR